MLHQPSYLDGVKRVLCGVGWTDVGLILAVNLVASHDVLAPIGIGIGVIAVLGGVNVSVFLKSKN